MSLDLIIKCRQSLPPIICTVKQNGQGTFFFFVPLSSPSSLGSHIRITPCLEVGSFFNKFISPFIWSRPKCLRHL